MSFELKLQLTGTTKNGAFMECNFLKKKSGRICRIILFGLLSAIGCQADYDDTRSNSDERARQRQNILTILKYFL
jgi:hypothetical protein